jgi:iron complex outermembrane receptor protein
MANRSRKTSLDKSDRRYGDRARSLWLTAMICGGFGIASLMVSGGAAAQASPASAADSSPELQEIVVTVERRSELLIDVPAAVTDLTSEVLQKTDLTNLMSINQIVPGVTLQSGAAYINPTIRGITSLTSGNGNESNTAIYVDGFYVSDTSSINMDLANVASIQVLKGPQGSLYGRNATGGAILINTLAPTNTWTGKIEGSYGNYDDHQLQAYISGPITDKIRFMAAGSFRDSDGWIKMAPDPLNPAVTGGDAAPIVQHSVRTKLEADITDNLKATLAGNYALTSDATGDILTPFAYVPSYLPPSFRATKFGEGSYNYFNEISVATNEGTLTLEYKTPIGTLTSYSGYSYKRFRVAFDFDGTYVDTGWANAPNKEASYQENLNFNITAIDHVDLTVGGDFFGDTYTEYPFGRQIFGPGQTFAESLHVPLQTISYAFFADGTIHLTDALALTLGARYSYDKESVSQTILGPDNVVYFPYTANHDSWTNVTPRAAIRYQIAPRTNVYASFSEGFRAGTFNSSPVGTPDEQVPIQPEKVNAYEVGIKTAQRAFRFETAFFYYDYKNLDVSLNVPEPGCGGPGMPCFQTNIIGNAPQATIYGIDGQFVVTPAERLNVTLGWAWLHARYGTFTNAAGEGIDPVTNLNVSQTQNWTGQQMARAPDFTGNIGVDYTMRVAGGKLLLAGNFNYTASDVLVDPSLYGSGPQADQQRYRQGGYGLLSAQVAWTDPSDHYRVSIYGKNLTDKVYRYTYDGAFQGDWSVRAEPISYGVRVGYKF